MCVCARARARDCAPLMMIMKISRVKSALHV